MLCEAAEIHILNVRLNSPEGRPDGTYTAKSMAISTRDEQCISMEMPFSSQDTIGNGKQSGKLEQTFDFCMHVDDFKGLRGGDTKLWVSGDTMYSASSDKI